MAAFLFQGAPIVPKSLAVFLLTLAAAASQALAQDAPRRAENVIVVTLDGFRPQEFFGGADASLIDPKAGGVPNVDALKQRYGKDTPEARREVLLPFLWGTVAKHGQIFGDPSRKASAQVTNGLKFSYPGYNEMFCGFADARIDSNDKTTNPNGSVLEFLNTRSGLKGKVAAFTTWDVFPFIFRSSENGLPVHAGWIPIEDEPLTDRQKMANAMVERLPEYWPGNVFDIVTMEAAHEHLKKHKPRVMFIGLGETDEWAHGRRYDLYLSSAHASDRYLSDLWHTLQEMPEYRDKTALIVTTDHGRGSTPANWTDHGQKVDGAENVWIAVIGPDTPAMGVREGVSVTQSQVAATIAKLIGEDFNAASPKSAKALPDISVPAAAK